MKIEPVYIEMKEFPLETRRLSGYPESFSKNDINEIESLFFRIKIIVDANIKTSFEPEDNYFNLINQLNKKMDISFDDLRYYYLEKKIFFTKAKGVVEKTVFYKTDPSVHKMLLPLAENYINDVKKLNEFLKQDKSSYKTLNGKITKVVKRHKTFTIAYSDAYCKHMEKVKKPN